MSGGKKVAAKAGAKKQLVPKNFSPEALVAIEAFRGIAKPPKPPASLRSPHEAAIRRAVRAHYLA